MKKLLLALTVSLLLCALVGCGGDNAESKEKSVDPNEITSVQTGSLTAAAERVVKSILKSPSTAEFPSLLTSDDWSVSRKGNMFTVSSWVDSQNSFGAVVRNNFTMKFEWNGNEGTEPTDIKSCIFDGKEML